jgi:hypothetical protein
VPLVAAVPLLLAAVPTYGIALLLSPLTVALTIVAARRVSHPRGTAFWLGASLTVWLTMGFLALLAVVVFDELAS